MRSRTGARAAWATAALVLASAAAAHAGVAWASTSVLVTSVAPPPVELELGSGASKSRYFDGLALSANKTSFTGTFKPRNGAEIEVQDVVRAHNRDDAPRTLTLRADQVSLSSYEMLEWRVHSGGSTVATLDLRAAQPSASVALAAGASVTLSWHADLVDASGKHNAATPMALWLEVS